MKKYTLEFDGGPDFLHMSGLINKIFEINLEATKTKLFEKGINHTMIGKFGMILDLGQFKSAEEKAEAMACITSPDDLLKQIGVKINNNG